AGSIGDLIKCLSAFFKTIRGLAGEPAIPALLVDLVSTNVQGLCRSVLRHTNSASYQWYLALDLGRSRTVRTNPWHRTGEWSYCFAWWRLLDRQCLFVKWS